MNRTICVVSGKSGWHQYCDASLRSHSLLPVFTILEVRNFGTLPLEKMRKFIALTRSTSSFLQSLKVRKLGTLIY